ncbi:MAG: glycosyl transferase group 1 [Acidobacteriales bacterium]|nr:glycosyl transferase group 1 [Terriglobales bacterium]
MTDNSNQNARSDLSISVVIPVRNEEAHIRFTLDALVTQEYPPQKLEILVVDGNSTDRTVEIVSEFARTSPVRIQVLPNPAQWSSSGRNIGIKASNSEIIAIIDGHCYIRNPLLLRNIVTLMESKQADCLCRPAPNYVEANTPFQDVLARTRASRLGHGLDSTIYDMQNERYVNPMSSGAIYRATVFDKVGLHDEEFDACEDVELNYRIWKAGLKSYSSPDLAIYYSPRKTLGSLWNQMLRYGQGRLRFMRKHPEAVSIGQLIPAGFVLWLLVTAALGFWWPLSTKIFAGTILIYLSAVIAFTIALAFEHGWRHLFLSPLVYFTVHFGLAAGFWREALRAVLRPIRKPSTQQNEA